MDIWVYDMSFGGDAPQTEVACVPFDEKYLQDYKESYNRAFRPMREALDIRPYDWYSDDEAVLQKAGDIYLLIVDGELAGSVACYGNEIDDLFVRSDLQGKGYGKQLLFWAMTHIKETSSEPITLTVAQWNQGALRMYLDAGFEIVNRKQVR